MTSIIHRVEFRNTVIAEAAPSPSDALGRGSELLWQLTGGTETMKVTRVLRPDRPIQVDAVDPTRTTVLVNDRPVLPNNRGPQTIRLVRLLTWVTLGLLFAAPATAHDFWIEPTSFSPEPGQAVAVRLLVGEHFSGDAVARPDATSLHRFVLVDIEGNASVTLPGRAGADPAGLLRLVRPGAYAIAFHGKPIAIELPAEKFNAYLADEGLESILAVRAERDQMKEPGREIFSRCAKSLLYAGPDDNHSGPADRALGLTLELIAERRPDRLRDGESLPVRVLHEGRPLAGVRVVAIHRADPHHPIARRSDAEGRVFLPLTRSGSWLVKAVHMRPAPAGSGADWESLWASLSFASGAPAR